MKPKDVFLFSAKLQGEITQNEFISSVGFLFGISIECLETVYKGKLIENTVSFLVSDLQPRDTYYYQVYYTIEGSEKKVLGNEIINFVT
ncbi:MAG: hypothetical protein ACEPOW_12850 [Bacteroidales bacterium]